MRKAVIAVTAVATLALGGIALAHGFDSKSVQAVSATFTATTATNVQTSSCTGANGHTYTTTRATYTGATAGATDPSLAGPIELDTQTVVDTTTGDGVMSGRLHIGATGGSTDAGFDAVVHGGTAVAGLAEGRASAPHSQLVANISAAYNVTGGFTSGMIGGGTGAGYAVEASEPGGCTPPPPAKPDRIEVHGAITSVQSTSISAAGVTCSIPTNLQAQVTALGLQNGQQIEMECTSTSGAAPTLVSIDVPGQHGGHGHDDHGHRLESGRR
jgi:hypothetical protein